MGLDDTERNVGYAAGGIAIVLAALYVPHLLKNTWVTDTATPSKTKTCPTHFHLVATVCDYRHLVHPSFYIPQFVLLLVMGVAILIFSRIRRRVGVAFSTLLCGLALGTVGLVYLFAGGWYIIRAFRLQRYGDPTFFGSSRRAKVLGEERRAEKAAGVSTKPARGKKVALAPSGPTASKRYTPKKRPRKR